MNKCEAEAIAEKYLSFQNEEYNLSIDIPVYTGCEKIYAFFLSIWHRNDPYFDVRNCIKSSKYKHMVVSRILSEMYESKIFWSVSYISNLPQEYIRYEELFSGGRGTFLICKKTTKIFKTNILNMAGKFDENRIAILEKDYGLYLKGEFNDVRHRGVWERGVLS